MMHSDDEMVYLRDVVETLIYMTDEDSDGVEEVMQLPTIEIVRCRECIHCADDYIDVGMGTMPQFTCELGRCGESVQPNDFCSYGERKVDE